MTPRAALLFSLAYSQTLPQDVLRHEAEIYGGLVRSRLRQHASWFGGADADRSLRLGFVSGDLREHPVGYFLESVLDSLAQLPPRQFELHAYSTMPVSKCDEVTSRLRKHFDHWHDVSATSDGDVVTMIHDHDKIDILIDLSGHTSYSRLAVFAARPSPVQVSWLGYFATTGLKEVDWFIADPVTMPAEFESHFTEKIWRLPDTRLCFSPPLNSPDVADLPALVHAESVTFGCFNHLAKMSDEVVALWARVLKAVNQSKLLLKSSPLEEEKVRHAVIARFAAHGVDASRILMEGLSSRFDYLATYSRIDIALDPFPYPGGTTSVEALWMGVPVLTLVGNSFLSRQGAGLLVNAGLPDWVAKDQDEYVRIAVEKSANLQALAGLRRDLRAQVASSPLMDAPLFVQHFSSALREMWQQWCESQSGKHPGSVFHQV
ncbi:MAG: hypothetical protein RLZZ271_1282, partial [Pseudomonadota bacterium]|jgi:predicted O-linked N-acetylglucosamine transferase (SPINDLY family)